MYIELSKSHAKRVWGPQNLSKPEGDFVGPQTLFAWDLHSQWMQTLQNTFTIILWE